MSYLINIHQSIRASVNQEWVNAVSRYRALASLSSPTYLFKLVV